MKLPQNAEHAACKAARSLRHRTENAVVFTDRTLFTGGVTYKHTQTPTHTCKDRQTRVVFEIPASIWMFLPDNSNQIWRRLMSQT